MSSARDHSPSVSAATPSALPQAKPGRGMKPGQVSPWTPENTAQAVVMWNAGQSAREIATALGDGFTRLSVISKVSREGRKVNGGRSAPNAFKREERRTRSAQPQRPKKAPAKVAKPKAAYLPLPDVAPGERHPPQVRIAQEVWAPLPGSSPVELVALKGHQCRWPVDVGEETLFCSLPAQDSYCKVHRSFSVGNG